MNKVMSAIGGSASGGKKIIISLSIIAAAAAVVVGATTAYFSDTETSTGNTFTAGKLDLTIDDKCSYNGVTQAFCTWGLKDLGAGDVFFNYDDVKPGDEGENTISIHIDDNPAWVCATISGLEDKDNGCNEPEAQVDTTCDDAVAPGQGELAENLFFTIWRDTDCDNDLDAGEVVLVKDQPASQGLWPIADSTTGAGAIKDACIGVMWSLPSNVDNIVQSDSLKGNISFDAIQQRHNDSFVCSRGY